MKHYCDTIEKQKEAVAFKPGQPKFNREAANGLFKVLKKGLEGINGVEFSKYYKLLADDDIKQILDDMRFEAKNQPLVFEVNNKAKNGEFYVLAQKDGKNLLVMLDMGPMETGWFKETDFHQLVLVFAAPDRQEGCEIGFSLNVKGGLNVILPPMRYELYPSFALLSVGNNGYTAMTYHNIVGDSYARYDYYEENGTKRTPSLWEKFLSL